MRNTIIAATIMTATALTFGAPAGVRAQEKATVSAATTEMRALVQAEQDERLRMTLINEDTLAAANARTQQRQQRAMDLLNAGALTTGEDFVNAALLFQTGDSIDSALVTHELALIGGTTGRFSSLMANAEDRFLIRMGRSQRFGTQFASRFAEEKPTLSAVQELSPGNGKNLPKVDNAPSDGLRMDLFVPPLSVTRRDGLDAAKNYTAQLLARQKERRDPAWIERMGKRPESAELARLGTDAAAKKATTTAARARVLELQALDAIATPSDYRNAALVLRYSGPESGGDVDDALLAHELAAVAMLRGDMPSRPIAAEALDLFLARSLQPQRYGTCLIQRADGFWSAPNVARSVSDSLRALYGVPTLAEAGKRFQELNAKAAAETKPVK